VTAKRGTIRLIFDPPTSVQQHSSRAWLRIRSFPSQWDPLRTSRVWPDGNGSVRAPPGRHGRTRGPIATIAGPEVRVEGPEARKTVPGTRQGQLWLGHCYAAGTRAAALEDPGRETDRAGRGPNEVNEGQGGSEFGDRFGSHRDRPLSKTKTWRTNGGGGLPSSMPIILVPPLRFAPLPFVPQHSGVFLDGAVGDLRHLTHPVPVVAGFERQDEFVTIAEFRPAQDFALRASSSVRDDRPPRGPRRAERLFGSAYPHRTVRQEIPAWARCGAAWL
jgi:hypothetical protein